MPTNIITIFASLSFLFSPFNLSYNLSPIIMVTNRKHSFCYLFTKWQPCQTYTKNLISNILLGLKLPISFGKYLTHWTWPRQV